MPCSPLLAGVPCSYMLRCDLASPHPGIKYSSSRVGLARPASRRPYAVSPAACSFACTEAWMAEVPFLEWLREFQATQPHPARRALPVCPESPPCTVLL